jgi:hypothetical protein
LVGAAPLGASDKPTPSRRWVEDQPGCTFSQGDDGTYRYGLWSGDYGIVMSVDAQEVEKALRRIEPLFAVLVTVRYRGKTSLDLGTDGISLELVEHYHDVHVALDPGALATELQHDVDQLAEATEREVHKHPEKKAGKETELQDQQKSVEEMKDFLKTKMLRPASLDSAHPEARGWVLFSLKSKWAGEWKKQEEFVLRVPVAGRVVEFPFALPPSVGAFVLRRR